MPAGQAAVTLTPWSCRRSANFGIIANAGDAADHADPDGWRNQEQEYVSGTDPNSRTSLLRIEEIQMDGSDIRIRFPTLAGRTYRVE